MNVYIIYKNTKEVIILKICKVEGCNRTDIKAKGYCGKHYNQILKHGKIYRTYRDLNEIIIHENYAEIILLNIKSEEIGRALIDIEDIDKVKNYRWCKHNGYARNNDIGNLHRFIMNAPIEMEVDHINHNRLDNRKSNLRVVTHQQNNMNKATTKSNTSGYPGVYWYKSRSKWQVGIKVNYKQIFLGYYDTLKEAIEVRKRAEIKYFGEYRNKNHKGGEDYDL